MLHLFEQLDSDLREELQKQLSILWTHDSTAIEGNTLTLGETDFLLREGLLASNRPLKDCMEVKCHYDAIQVLVHQLCAKKQIGIEDIQSLHRVLMPSSFAAPETLGAWKQKANATTSMDAEGSPFLLLYPLPREIPDLMKRFADALNTSAEDPLAAFCQLHLLFVSIHPFADGNGRMARLLANIPLLRAGELPVIIASRARQRYLELIRQAQPSIPVQEINGQRLRKIQIPDAFAIAPFQDFAQEQIHEIRELVDATRALQKMRE